jgi:hypothetical protein
MLLCSPDVRNERPNNQIPTRECFDVSRKTVPMRLLRVDLRRRRAVDELVPEDDLLKYVGGRGLAAKILYDENTP